MHHAEKRARDEADVITRRWRVWEPGSPPVTAPRGLRILVVKPSSLGDVVHTLPLVHAVKRNLPESFIGWVVQDAFVGVLKDDRAVDAIHSVSIPSTSDPYALRWAWAAALRATVDAFRRLRAEFRSSPYHLVLDLHASFRSGVLGSANRAENRLGFCDAKEMNTLFQDYLISAGAGAIHAVERNCAFASALGLTVLPEDFRLVYGEEERHAAAMFVNSPGVAHGRRLIYANPVARWATKLWTVQGWARLADMLLRERGAQVVFAGAASDIPYLRAVTNLMQTPAPISAGVLSLGASAALADLCDAYVGVDSGPMHIAAMLGKPVVALFGPTDPAKVGPYGNGHIVIRREDLDCLGCRRRACSKRDCLDQLSHETVFEHVKTVLDRSRH